METEPVPASPVGAFNEVGKMADKLNMSIMELCGIADVSHSPVYRWKKNQRTYDVSLFVKIRAVYEARRTRKKKATK